MLPCPISVYVEGGTITVCALKPKLMGAFYPEAGISETAPPSTPPSGPSSTGPLSDRSPM